MSTGPDFSKPNPEDPNGQPSEQGQGPSSHGAGQQPYGAAPGAPQYGQQPYGNPQYGQQPYGAPMAGGPAPYGVHPVTGMPYSDKSKLVAGLLQILIPLGIGRFYIGDSRTGVFQLLVTIFTCGVGAIWPFIDGIMMLVGDPVDQSGRPLRS